MMLNMSQKAKSLIIKTIRKTDINEIMPILISTFRAFFNAYFCEGSVSVLFSFR